MLAVAARSLIRQEYGSHALPTVASGGDGEQCS